MNRFLSFLIFILIFSSIYFGIHYFVYFNISRRISFSSRGLLYLKLFFIISGLSILIGSLLSRFLQFSLIKQYSYIWMGIISIGFFVFLLGFIILKLLPSQSRIIVIISIVLTITISLISMVNEFIGPVINKIYIPIAQSVYPAAQVNFSIVQLSDLHLENSTSSRWVRGIVERINSINPDIVVITGDLIDEKIHDKKNFHTYFKNLKTKYGVYAITGNHEYYAGIHNFLELCEKSNIQVLRNEILSITDSVDLIGVDDRNLTPGMSSKYGEVLDNLLNKTNKEKIQVLLSHRPFGFEKVSERGVKLQLSGHTHNGQIIPMNFIVQLYYEYPYGLYQKNDSYIYTSCGTGLWGPPMRIFSRSEIVHIVLKKGEN